MLQQIVSPKNVLSILWNSFIFFAIAPTGAGANRFVALSVRRHKIRENIKQTTSEEPDEV